MIFELLESRCLLSASLLNGTLTITGTVGADLINIGLTNGQVTVNDNGVSSQFASPLVSYIRVNLRGGNDRYSASGVPIASQIEGGIGDDSIVGGTRADRIFSGDGNDTLWGTQGNDLFVTGSDATRIYGGQGKDTLRGGSGDDLFYGGRDPDTADYSQYSVRVSVRLDTLANDGEAGEMDNIALDVEHVIGTPFNDWISGGRELIHIEAGDGDDTLLSGRTNSLLEGGAGNDKLGGRVGDDTMFGGAGDDSLDGGMGNDEFHGDDGTDVVSYALRSENLVLRVSGNAESGADGENDLIGLDMEDIRGGTGDDLFVGSDNPETYYGRGGNDTIDGGWGNDTLWGGAGIDAGDYSSRSSLQQLRINEGTGIPGEQDIPHDDIEVLIGGSGDDWIQGGWADNLLIGNGGNDTLMGMGGEDTLVGGEGADVLGYAALDGGPSSQDGDSGDDVIYTFEIDNDHDGSTDRISDVVGTNILHYSLLDPDELLT